MKKLSVLLIVSILATTLLAAVVPAKLVRLEVYNWTGENVYIRLTGQVTGAFYYLTVPPTTRATGYSPKTFTVLTDVYSRTTWACGGVQTTGQYRILKNNRLTFTACGTLPKRWALGNFILVGNVVYQAPNFGEPSMEKVVFYSQVTNRVWIKVPWVFVGSGVGPNGFNNFWFQTPGGDPTGFFGYGVPFILYDFCAPNNCYWRVSFDFFTGTIGLFYGPGAANRFRYRY
jgi:hypothetical protein